MTQTNSLTVGAAHTFPATARLRARVLIATDIEELVLLFASALSEYGIFGHFCHLRGPAGFVALAGDCPELIATPAGSIIVDAYAGQRVVLAMPSNTLSAAVLVRLQGYAELYAARAAALQEQADDVETECGLSLRERYVLGRRLAGLAPIDIAIESGLSVQTVATAIDTAIERLRAKTLVEAIALAARRGWLAVTNLQNCSSSSQKLTYKVPQNS